MMRTLKRASAVASLGLAVATTAATFGAGSAGALTVPTGSPRYFIGKVTQGRGAGSDTTFFMMQKISDLWGQAGLYGCTLNADNATCNTGADDPRITDTVDNYDRNEQTQGVDKIGSSAGIGQLCGTVATPFPVDYARSSRGLKSTDCATAVGEGYAKDGVLGIDFQGVNPSDVGATVGPFAAGWRPGDPVGGPYSGRAFSSLPNNDNGGGRNSTAFRIYCATDATRITDWGQLTDPAQPVGAGAAFGAPIAIMAVNSSSGTFSTFQSFVNSGVTDATTGNPVCNANVNATTFSAAHPLLENNAAQVSQDVVDENPGNVQAQATELASALYFMANGVYNTNPYAKTVTVNDTTTTPATLHSYVSTKMSANGVGASAATINGGTYPMARTLYNVYRTDTVRASTASFLNWICDNTSANKATDLNTGKNFNDELTAIIVNQYGFPRQSCPLITAVGDPNS